MAFAARRNRPFLPGNSITHVDLEDQIFSTPANFLPETLNSSFAAPYPVADASPAGYDQRKSTPTQASNIETESEEDEYFMSVLAEQMAHAMLNEESEKVDEASKAYEADWWENSYDVSEKNLCPLQETLLQSINFRESAFYADELPLEKTPYPLGHVCSNYGKHNRLCVDSQTSLANVEAFSDLNACILESALNDQRSRDFSEQILLRSGRNVPVSQLPLLIKALDHCPNLRKPSSERTLINSSLWKPIDHRRVVSNKQFLKQSTSSGCVRANKSQYQQSKPNIKWCQKMEPYGNFANPNTAHCRSAQLGDGGVGLRALFVGHYGSVKESVGTGVFLPRSHAPFNDSKRKQAPSMVKASASLYQKASGSYKHNQSDKMAFSSHNKKLPPEELHPSMESRLPTEWTY